MNKPKCWEIISFLVAWYLGYIAASGDVYLFCMSMGERFEVNGQSLFVSCGIMISAYLLFVVVHWTRKMSKVVYPYGSRSDRS